MSDLQPVVWLSGPPAAGKTTFAVPLARALGAALIDLDTATNPMTRPLLDLLGTGDLDDERFVRLAREPRYEVVHALALDNLRVGRPSVCVAPFTRERTDPDAVADLGARYADAGGRPVLVWLETPPEVIAQRMAHRAAPRDRDKLADPRGLASRLRLDPPNSPHLVVPWPRDEAAAVEDLVGRVRALSKSRPFHPVRQIPPGVSKWTPAEEDRPMTDANAVRYFQDKLAYESSPREVVVALQAGEKMTIVDVRRPEAYTKGHIPGSVNIPVTEAQSDASDSKLDKGTTVVVYDWGPASTESTLAALSLAARGFRVREMLGGYEYWNRLGLGIENADGVVRRRVSDPLVTTSEKGWD